MKKPRIASLMTTMTTLNQELSLIPMTRIQVMSPTMATAGTLTTIGIPNRCGASESASAARTT